MMIPEDLRYTAEHEWIRSVDSVPGAIRVGITDFAQDALGDIVYVSLPQVDAEVTAGQPCGELESTKSVSDVYAPLSGRVIAINERLDPAPEVINTTPYDEGWLFEMLPVDAAAADHLLDAEAYRASLS